MSRERNCSKFKKNKNFKLKTISRKNVDIVTQFPKLCRIIHQFKPEFIINCVALTRLIYCEDKPKLAYEINAYFPFQLVKYLKNKKTKLIHFT